jgi:hypothetical protein
MSNIGASRAGKVWRFIKRLFVWSIVSFFLLVGISWLLVFIFEKDVIRFASDKLNSNLNSEIRFESVDLTFLKTFPYASLEFKDVSCNEYLPSKKKVEPLFKASYLYLQFNVWDLFSGKYSVKRITLKDADLNLYRDRQGNDNWHIWKETESPAPEKEKFSFKLSAVKLVNVRVNYTDHQAKGYVAMKVKDLYFSGNFTEEKYTLSAESDMVLTQLKWGDAEFPGPLNLGISATLQVDNTKKTYKISYGSLELNKMNINCEGGFVDMEEGLYAEMKFQGNKLNIGEVLNLLPDRYSGFRDSYDGSGIMDLGGSVKGFLDDGSIPETSLSFSGSNISFQAREENIQLSDVNFKGTFDYFPNEAKKSRLELTSFSAKMPSSEFMGSISVVDFDMPHISAAIKAKINLVELFTFFPVDTLEKISGRMDADVRLNTVIGSNHSFSLQDLSTAKVIGSIVFQNVGMQVKKSPFAFEDVSGRLEFNNTDVYVRELSGFLAGNDFTLNGDALNLLPYLFVPNQNLKVVADLECRSMNAEKFFSETKGSGSSSAVLPDHVALELNARMGKFVYKKFEASDIKGKINLYNRVLSVEGIYMKTLGGSVYLNGLADNRSGRGFQIACNGTLNNISVSDFFYRFDNFGQNAIDHEHIKGTLDAFVEFKANFTSDLKTDQKSIYLKTDLEIVNGELNRFEPLKALAGWVKMEELENIRFAKLKNTIYIKDETVIIPDMAVYSNALDINISGKHQFDNYVDYSFNLYLGDILANKFRILRRPDKQGEFGELIPDKGRTRLFIRMFGPGDDPQFTYDKSSVKQKLSQDIQKEKINVKNILDAEYGRIKNDSLLKNDVYLKQKNDKREKKRKESEGSDEFEFE